MVRGSGAPWDLRKSQPYECYDRNGFRHPGRQERRLLRPLSDPHGGDARVGAIMKQCIAKLLAPEGPGPVSNDRRQGRAAEARRDEALDGSADPPLQALHRRLPRARGRGLCRVEAPKGEFGVYLVPTAPTSPIAARSARRASRICRRWISCAGPHAGRRRRDPRLDRHRVRGGRPLMRRSSPHRRKGIAASRGSHRTVSLSFAFTPENLAMGEGADREISRRPSGLGGHSAALARRRSRRRLGAAPRSKRGRERLLDMPPSASGGRDLLHDVQPGEPVGRAIMSGVRHHAVHAARLGRSDRKVLRRAHRPGRTT
jgi:hypothetical protein